MSSVEKWFPYRRGAGGLELFAFPHAGAASTVFNDLREHLRLSGVALSAAVLPGHGRRLRETPHRRIEPLLAEFDAMARRDGYAAFMGDYALLGHCSGALVAYEVAQLLVRAPCRNPRLLVVCGCLPPRVVFDTGMGRLPTRELLAQTASMGGTDESLMADPDFIEMIERPLRADWELYDGYVFRPAPPLPVPILAIRGAEDENVDTTDLSVWQEQTREPLVTAELGAGHWALEAEGSVELARQIVTALAPAVRPG
ncbi:thioesterase [Asanoa ishikariensis]|uniref:Surfactin synthase thioesterase subunit n=1 Tax=Asanoa ishikariensis TaxID=137265 RepID=A0A1H3TC82_9ACTN|nr:alpha/beta fold hydrolase [Asanoa ishikariensis]GIF62814.1 thioesterase [Asanoa ishikariensis]SDZ46939.1 Surfactin synthase thioesterase subunit [Asanoa ishikariensis]